MASTRYIQLNFSTWLQWIGDTFYLPSCLLPRQSQIVGSGRNCCQQCYLLKEKHLACLHTTRFRQDGVSSGLLSLLKWLSHVFKSLNQFLYFCFPPFSLHLPFKLLLKENTGIDDPVFQHWNMNLVYYYLRFLIIDTLFLSHKEVYSFFTTLVILIITHSAYYQ